MKIMIDTNVIISSLLKQGSVPDIVLNYVCNNHNLILCDHIINECYTVAKRRFPTKIDVLNDLFAKMRYELVAAPRTGEILIRDVKDQPILNAAVTHVEILVTGKLLTEIFCSSTFWSSSTTKTFPKNGIVSLLCCLCF